MLSSSPHCSRWWSERQAALKLVDHLGGLLEHAGADGVDAISRHFFGDGNGGGAMGGSGGAGGSSTTGASTSPYGSRSMVGASESSGSPAPGRASTHPGMPTPQFRLSLCALEIAADSESGGVQRHAALELHQFGPGSLYSFGLRSTEPMSHAPACGRVIPRWSVVPEEGQSPSAAPTGMTSTAGLAGRGTIV